MTLPPHLRRIAEAIRAADIEPPPTPWAQLGFFHVGGLRYVGFAPDSELLLVVSWNGRGVVDCNRGEMVSRDGDTTDEWLDESSLDAVGIGPLEGQQIRIAGLCGGALPSVTRGWTIESFTLDWPDEAIVLSPSLHSVWYEASGRDVLFTKIALDSEIRAFGFSPSGRTLVLATSCDLAIYGRDE